MEEHLPETMPVPAEMLVRAITVVKEDRIAPLEDPKSGLITVHGPDKIQGALRIYRDELAALEALDAQNVTYEEIDGTQEEYEAQVRKLFEKPE